MKPWIIDASLAINWYLTDEQDRNYSISVFKALGERQVLVPSLWVYEISNVLLVAHRRGRIPKDRIDFVLAAVMGLNIRIDQVASESASELTRLALKHGLTVYDASYLDLALRSGASVATLDKALIAAMKAAGVELVNP